ncbi:MAG TPA: (2Fe-2S) ferredoxin domain-containing protein [Chroococcales cyanobacterium]|jgi:NADP-reducing hydrogenase subunit HndB
MEGNKTRITLEDLKRIKNQAAQGTVIREGEQATKITVHMGTCGIAAGAREVMTVLLAEIQTKNVQGITVAHASCIGLCDREPIVTVQKPNVATVRYGQVDPAKMARIFEEHVMGDRMIPEWIIKGA